MGSNERVRMREISQVNKKGIGHKIIDALRAYGPMSFAELTEKTGIPKSSLSMALKEMEDLKEINRDSVPREDKKGRQRHNKILIKLSPTLADPAYSTLDSLANVSPLVHLDIEAGKKILTDDVVQSAIEISNLRWSIKSNRITSKIDLRIADPELTELTLLKALARYMAENRELCRSPHDSLDIPFRPLEHSLIVPFPDYSELKMSKVDLAKYAKSLKYLPSPTPKTFMEHHGVHVSQIHNRYDEWLKSNIYPVLKFLMDKNLIKAFDDLMIWIDPLIDHRKNLAANFFWEEISQYSVYVLWPLWKVKANEIPKSFGVEVTHGGGKGFEKEGNT